MLLEQFKKIFCCCYNNLINEEFTKDLTVNVSNANLAPSAPLVSEANVSEANVSEATSKVSNANISEENLNELRITINEKYIEEKYTDISSSVIEMSRSNSYFHSEQDSPMNDNVNDNDNVNGNDNVNEKSLNNTDKQEQENTNDNDNYEDDAFEEI